MTAKRWDKSRMPSRHVTVGPDRAPHRSYYYAMGLTQEEIDNLVSTLQQKLDDGTFFDEAVQLSDEEAEAIFDDIERKKLNRAPRQ
jgi:GTPase Era involved in 16S rRNA processing